MPTPKKLNRKAPMSIMQQFGSNEELRSLQRQGQRSPEASRDKGDRYNKRKYRTMRYVEGERSQGRSASYEQGGSMDMPLPESIRGDKKFDSAQYKGKFNDTLAKNADNLYVDDGLRFYSFDDDGFYVVDKDNNTWGVEKWYSEEGDEYDELALDDYVMEKLGAKRVPLEETSMAYAAKGGQGASATEDLLERLTQNKRDKYGDREYEQGGMVAKKKGSTIKIAGQYAVDSIKTTPEGNQYVSMELPDGKVVPVFGDWETYGNPDREGRIEDLDFRIYPLGDGTYALDAAEAEAEMLRDEARGVAREAVGGMGASPTEDLLERLNQRGGMGFTPSGRMRPVRRQ